MQPLKKPLKKKTCCFNTRQLSLHLFFPYIKQLYSFYQGASTIDRKIRDTLNCCNGCVYRLKNLPKKNDNHIGCTCNTLVLNMLKTKPSKPKRSFIQAQEVVALPTVITREIQPDFNGRHFFWKSKAQGTNVQDFICTSLAPTILHLVVTRI